MNRTWNGNAWVINGAKCPDCKQPSVVYNGNYYCDNPFCDWAMDQNDPENRPEADREILRLAGVDGWGNRLPLFVEPMEP